LRSAGPPTSKDFSASAYNGSLQLAGTDAGGGVRDFGQWTFAGSLGFGQMSPAPLEGPENNDPASEIDPRFYGPSGQEIGAVFNMRIGWLPDY